MSALAQLSAPACRAGYASGEISLVEVTRAVLDELAEVEPTINAFVHVDAERALAAAEESEARWRAGAPLGPFDGVPGSVTEMLLTPTMITLPLPIGAGAGPRDTHWYEIDGEVWSPYTFAFNMTQQSAASIPCGLAARPEAPAIRLPVGLQIVGAPYADALVLCAARAFDATRDWLRPAFPFPGAEGA